MPIPLVMTIIGPDRTGLVESLAGCVAENGGNWLESRLCRLGGEFAGILRIEIPDKNKSTLFVSNTILSQASGSDMANIAGDRRALSVS